MPAWNADDERAEFWDNAGGVRKKRIAAALRFRGGVLFKTPVYFVFDRSQEQRQLERRRGDEKYVFRVVFLFVLHVALR